MYWQVYLHKTSLAAELILLKLLERFKVLVTKKKELISNSHLLYPLINPKSGIDLSQKVLMYYLSLEDSDILFLLKSWTKHNDIILSSLSKQIIYSAGTSIQTWKFGRSFSQTPHKSATWHRTAHCTL